MLSQVSSIWLLSFSHFDIVADFSGLDFPVMTSINSFTFQTSLTDTRAIHKRTADGSCDMIMGMRKLPYWSY